MRLRSILIGAGAVALGVGLIVLLLRATGVTGADLARALRNVRPGPILVIAAAVGVSLLAGAEKWRLVEAHLSGASPSRRKAFGLTAMGSALGQFMPVPISSAIVRGGGNHLIHGSGGRRGAFSSVWEQLFDFGVICLLAAPALLALRLGDFRWYVIGAPVLALAVDQFVGPLTVVFRRMAPKAGPLLNPRLSRNLYRLALVRFAALTAMMLGAATAIAAPIPLLPLAAAVPPVGAAATLSLLPSGLGVSDWTYVLILGVSGVPQHTAATFAVLSRVLVGAVSVGFGLVGWTLIWTKRSTLAGATASGDGGA